MAFDYFAFFFQNSGKYFFSETHSGKKMFQASVYNQKSTVCTVDMKFLKSC